MKPVAAVLLLFAFAIPAHAEPRIQFPTAAERHAADLASWVTVGLAVAGDVVGTWQGHCRDTWDHCEVALVKSGLRYGVNIGATQLVKHLVHRDRPCAPSCGVDAPDQSFFSGHTAIAFSTVGGARLAFSVPLAIGTGGLRVAAGKHWASDTVVGALVGLATSRIR